MSRYTIYAVNAPGGLIGGCQGNTFEMDENEIIASGDGTVDATYAALMSAMPKPSFDTVNVAVALGIAGISGLGYDASDLESAALEFFAQKFQDGGTRAAGASHIKLSSAVGILVPTRLTAQQRQFATLSMQAFTKSTNGAAPPLTITVDQALAGSPSVSELFTVGPAAVNSTGLGEVVEVNLDFGITVAQESANGLTYPTTVYIVQRRPVLRVRTKSVELAETMVGNGLAVTTATAYLRKIAKGGTRVADGTAQHVKLTMTAGRAAITSIQGTDGEQEGATAEVTITPTYDGTNDVVAINTASAIT